MPGMDLIHTAQIIVLSARVKALEEALDSPDQAWSKCQRNERVREIVCQLLEASEKEIPSDLHERLRDQVEAIVGTCGDN